MSNNESDALPDERRRVHETDEEQGKRAPGNASQESPGGANAPSDDRPIIVTGGDS